MYYLYFVPRYSETSLAYVGSPTFEAYRSRFGPHPPRDPFPLFLLQGSEIPFAVVLLE